MGSDPRITPVQSECKYGGATCATCTSPLYINLDGYSALLLRTLYGHGPRGILLSWWRGTMPRPVGLAVNHAQAYLSPESQAGTGMRYEAHLPVCIVNAEARLLHSKRCTTGNLAGNRIHIGV